MKRRGRREGEERRQEKRRRKCQWEVESVPLASLEIVNLLYHF